MKSLADTLKAKALWEVILVFRVLVVGLLSAIQFYELPAITYTPLLG